MLENRMFVIGGTNRANIVMHFTTKPLHLKETIPENIMLSVLQRTIKYTSSAKIILFLLCLFCCICVVVDVVIVHPFGGHMCNFQPKLCF